MSDEDASAEELRRERYELLARLDDGLEAPMVVLAFVWLALLVVELIRGESLLFSVFGTIIRVIFILDFAVKLILAPDKSEFFKGHWLTAIALVLPARRIFRIFRVFRLLRLALYAFGVFGYVTAALATFFVGRDANDDDAELAGAKHLMLLRDEMTALRADLTALRSELRDQGYGRPLR